MVIIDFSVSKSNDFFTHFAVQTARLLMASADSRSRFNVLYGAVARLVLGPAARVGPGVLYRRGRTHATASHAAVPAIITVVMIPKALSSQPFVCPCMIL